MKELIATWKDGTQVFLGAAINRAKTGGVGFIVRPKYVKNISLCKIISERIAFLIIQINQKTTIKFISCYAPTTDYKDEDLEEFYKLLSKVLEHKSTYTIICGDLNAKLGIRKDQGRFVGPYGHGKRNERGDRLDEFAETEQLYVMNTFFKKRSGKRWTWSCKGPNSAIIKNEIDYIMCNCKRLVKNVETIGKSYFDIFSDHRPVRATLQIDQKLEGKIRAISNHIKKPEELDKYMFRTSIDNTNWNITGNIDDDYQ